MATAEPTSLFRFSGPASLKAQVIEAAGPNRGAFTAWMLQAIAEKLEGKRE